MIGGCAVGTIGIFMPIVLGEGYHPIMEMVGGTFPMAFWLIFIGIFLKIFVTAINPWLGRLRRHLCALPGYRQPYRSCGFTKP